MVPPQWVCVKDVKVKNFNYHKIKTPDTLSIESFLLIEIKSVRIIQPLPLQQRSQQPLQVHQPSL